MSHKAHMNSSVSSHSFGRDLHMINAANMAMNAHLHAGNSVHHLQQQQQHHQPTNLSITNQQNVSLFFVLFDLKFTDNLGTQLKLVRRFCLSLNCLIVRKTWGFNNFKKIVKHLSRFKIYITF